jgi:hypothetical protein
MFTDDPDRILAGFCKIALSESKREPTKTAKGGNTEVHNCCDARSKAFDAKAGRPPKISLLNYVKRIWQYGLELSEDMLSCFGAALVLMRLVACSIKLTALNIHRVVALCLLVVTKHGTDYYTGDLLWAQVLGIEHEELKQLEEELYDIIDCQVEVSAEEVDHSMREIAHANGHPKLLVPVQATVLDSINQYARDHGIAVDKTDAEPEAERVGFPNVCGKAIAVIS